MIAFRRVPASSSITRFVWLLADAFLTFLFIASFRFSTCPVHIVASRLQLLQPPACNPQADQ
ncbi:MAG: hypothetical protein H7833_07760 [Magnetococcus sp. DMHC-1]|nr:hypothetical protein [Magnetococcales bacterium]